MTHNTDIGDSWEREGDDPTFFYRFGVPGYAFGINVMLYALTHLQPATFVADANRSVATPS